MPARASWLLALTLTVVAGCAENSMVLKGQVNQFQEQQLAMARQNEQLQQRAAALDRDNQELGTLLAQARQRSQLTEDQVATLRDQLRGVTAELAQTRQQKQATAEQVEALTASMRRRGGVTITPNNSLLDSLPVIDEPGVHVRRDGDVIRIELPGDDLFPLGNNELKVQAVELIVRIAAELLSAYPNQMIGLEGHTDNEPVQGGAFRDSHELSVAQAKAVYEVLVSRTRLQPGQLFLAGHGANHPIVSNATLEGRRRNRRVELVIYPETWR